MLCMHDIVSGLYVVPSIYHFHLSHIINTHYLECTENCIYEQLKVCILAGVYMIGLPTKKSKVLRFQICCTRTKYLSEIYKNRTIKVGAAKLFSVNLSWT